MRVAFARAKGAELAREDAVVRVVDVLVVNVGGHVPVLALAQDVRDAAQSINIRGTVEARRFVLVNSLTRHDLIADRAQFLRNEADAREIFHRLNLTQDESRIKLAANFPIFQSNIWSCTVL